MRCKAVGEVRDWIEMKRKTVVVIGAGFGGLSCVRKLGGKNVDVVLIDRNNYHLFTPLLYQVASSLLNPNDIARPVRAIVSGYKNVRFRRDTVTSVDFEAKEVRTGDGSTIPYDYLVLATGSTTNFYGNAHVEQLSFGLKDLPEAMELRNQVLTCLETAATVPAAERAAWLTFVVAGGGPTGVEYAGALSELVSLILPEEYPELARERPRIVLVEGTDRVLPPFPEVLSQRARRDLEKKGIEVHTGVLVSDVGEAVVELADGSKIAAHTIVWAAGVKAASPDLTGPASTTRSGRIEVDETLRIRGREDVFVIGDLASLAQDGKEIPMLATPAMQEGRAVAANILRSVEGIPLKPFRYSDRGSMATIGKNTAVVSIGRFRLDGVIGWLTWLAVHLYYLIGFRNRVMVLASWAANYLKSERPVRLITRARDRDRHTAPETETPKT